MAKLDAKQRAQLPDSAFAYIDSKGRRLLPIHDESHVRNALARFNQVKFESTEAREKAFRKLLKTAVGHGIAPVGFVATQVRMAESPGRRDLPQGQVTFMITDMEGSTGLTARLGDGYGELLEEVRGLISDAVDAHDGYEVDSRADEFFAVFPAARQAAETAVAIQLEVARRDWPDRVRVRIGLHSGSPARTETGYVGLAVNTVSRICTAGHGGQVLVSKIVHDEVAGLPGLGFTALGRRQLRGLPEEIDLYQLDANGLDTEFPPLRI
jgi:class 3 adenylate cyclase